MSWVDRIFPGESVSAWVGPPTRQG